MASRKTCRLCARCEAHRCGWMATVGCGCGMQKGEGEVLQWRTRWKGDRRSRRCGCGRQNEEGRQAAGEQDREDPVHGQSSRGWGLDVEAAGPVWFRTRAIGNQLWPAGDAHRGQ